MSTTTVRLDGDEEAMLDLLAEEHGGRSGAIRFAIRQAAQKKAQRVALEEFLETWETAGAPITDAEVEELAERYQLGTPELGDH